jgi:two-component system NarL family response regulator
MDNVDANGDDRRARVVIIDDHPSIRIALEYILSAEPDICVLGSTDGAAFDMSWYATRKPDITLMDLHMPGQGGFVLIEKIRKDFPNANIIVITAFDRVEDIYRSIRAGVKGYVVKDAPVQHIVDAVRAVKSGNRYFPVDILDKIVARISVPDLSVRELEVMHRMALGESNKAIADALSISVSAVKFNVQNILAKLGANDRTQAVVTAIRLGIADIGL